MIGKCYICKEKKDITFFYKDKWRKTGFMNKCKNCCRLYMRKRQEAHPEAFRRTHLKWYAKNKDKVKANWQKWYKENKHKVQAHGKVKTALFNGKLKREPCEKCGKEKSMAHHDDYSKPLDVRWLCQRHHQRHHYPELSSS